MAKLGDVIDYLKYNKAHYEMIDHDPTISPQEVAVGIQGPKKNPAKTHIVHADGKYYMIVMPADNRIVDSLLLDVLKAKYVHLASEEDIQLIFPECEVGTMPPFGNLFALPVYIDKMIADDDMIIFRACSQTRLIRLKMYDFLRLVKPVIAEFSQSRIEMKEPL
jgi:Ala-tRNA(Pro) deacylase